MSRRVLDRWDWACTVAPGRLTGSQRAVLQVIARHADDAGANSFVGQDGMAASAGLSDTGAVRKVLRRLVSLRLIEAEHRPGKTTVWRLRLDWTPVPGDRTTPVPRDLGDAAVPRSSRTSVRQLDPGPTPVQPRSLRTDEGEGEGTTTPLTLNVIELRRAREDGTGLVHFNVHDLPRPGSKAVTT